MKKTSTPIWIYIVLLFVCITLIVPNYLVKCKCIVLFSILCNIGYGLLGSSLVAFLIDIANTKRKVKQDHATLKIMSAEYFSAFLDLRDCVISVAELRYGTDGIKRTFNEWIEYVLAPAQNDETSDDVNDIAIDIFIKIEKIEKAADKLYELLLLNLDNSWNTTEYRQSVRAVCHVASYISQLIRIKDYVHTISSIENRLVSKFLKSTPNAQDYFLVPYCEDRFTEE